MQGGAAGKLAAMGHGHNHTAAESAVPVRARRIVTAVAVVLGVMTLAGVAILWPRQDPHGHLNGLHATSDVYEATTVGVHGGVCGTAGGDTSQRCTQIRFQLDQGPDTGRFRTIEFAQTVSAPNVTPGDKVVLNHIERRGTWIRLHLQRSTTPINAAVARSPLRDRGHRARTLARSRRPRRPRCQHRRHPGVHVAIDARRQQRTARRHRRLERGRVRRALPLQRLPCPDDRRAARNPLGTSAHRHARNRVHRPGPLHRDPERGCAPRRDRLFQRRPQEPRPRGHGPRRARRSRRHHRDASLRGRRTPRTQSHDEPPQALPRGPAHWSRPHLVHRQHAGARLCRCVTPVAHALHALRPEPRDRRQRRGRRDRDRRHARRQHRSRRRRSRLHRARGPRRWRRSHRERNARGAAPDSPTGAARSGPDESPAARDDSLLAPVDRGFWE